MNTSQATKPDCPLCRSNNLLGVPALLDHYNLSFNIGKLAGQTSKHLHMWVVPRSAGQAAGKGLATLVSEASKT